MSTDPRIALESLTSTLQEHLAAATGKRGDSDPVLDVAYQSLADAFEDYEDALYEATGEVTPLDLFDDDDDDDDGADSEEDVYDPDEFEQDDEVDDFEDEELAAAESNAGGSA